MAQIMVYSTPTCPYCKMVKSYLAEKGLGFEEVDVANSQAQAQEMIKKSGQMGVPVVEIGGQIIIGFDRSKIDQALKEG